jgi:hypothetical protein
VQALSELIVKYRKSGGMEEYCPLNVEKQRNINILWIFPNGGVGKDRR